MNTLKRGLTLSCGCLRLERIIETSTTHGHSRGRKVTPTYYAWRSMKSRCHNPNVDSYKDYGARGIFVCNQWRDDFGQFVNDMGLRPDGLSLERIDNDKGYSPENCVWADNKTQANNRRSTQLVVFKGEVMSVSAASEKAGISCYAVFARIYRGWPEERWFEPLRGQLQNADQPPR